jgi:hypothetical protein
MEVGMGKIVIKRKDLYALVWSEPIVKLLKKYEITHSELIHLFLPDYVNIDCN